jgi:hypothetical protein
MTTRVTFDDYEFGVSWTQPENFPRSSHALKDHGRAWLVDPVDSLGDVERAIGDCEPVGVIQLLDRHNRDCIAVAERLEVPLFRLPRELPDAPFTPFSVIDRPKWREVALWWPEHQALVVPEAIGSVKETAVADTGIAIHPMLRLTPPSALRRYPDVQHILPGHGKPLHGRREGEQLQNALEQSRRDIPRMITKIPSMIKAASS